MKYLIQKIFISVSLLSLNLYCTETPSPSKEHLPTVEENNVLDSELAMHISAFKDSINKKLAEKDRELARKTYELAEKDRELAEKIRELDALKKSKSRKRSHSEPSGDDRPSIGHSPIPSRTSSTGSESGIHAPLSRSASGELSDLALTPTKHATGRMGDSPSWD